MYESPTAKGLTGSVLTYKVLGFLVILKLQIDPYRLLQLDVEGFSHG
jgi:hypothetical protein